MNTINSVIKFDLHIHSKASEYKEHSNIVKESTKDNLDNLFQKLDEHQVGLFLITDHNRFDSDLYQATKNKLRSGQQKYLNVQMRRFGLIDAWCDFVCLLGGTPAQRFDETGTEIPAKPYTSDFVSLKTLKNARLPSGFAEFSCHFYNSNFKDRLV